MQKNKRRRQSKRFGNAGRASSCRNFITAIKNNENKRFYMLEKNRKRRRNSTRGVHPTKEVELKVSVHQRRSRKTAGRSFKTGSGS